jgi:hypothetical protein
VSLPIAAQTSGELRKKYPPTSAVEGFEVRPGIIATVYYGANGQAFQVLIRHRRSSTSVSAQDEMPYKLFAELLDEFAPAAKRGRLCSPSEDFQSGRNHYVTTTYENVSIHSVEHDTDQDRATASSVQISWEKVYCPVEAGDDGAPK